MALEQALEIQLKRIRFRSWHRGCKETDLVLGRFADTGLGALDTAEIALYEALLDENDNDIWNWLVERQPAPERYASLLVLLRAHNLECIEKA